MTFFLTNQVEKLPIVYKKKDKVKLSKLTLGLAPQVKLTQHNGILATLASKCCFFSIQFFHKTRCVLNQSLTFVQARDNADTINLSPPLQCCEPMAQFQYRDSSQHGTLNSIYYNKVDSTCGDVQQYMSRAAREWLQSTQQPHAPDELYHEGMNPFLRTQLVALQLSQYTGTYYTSTHTSYIHAHLATECKTYT